MTMERKNWSKNELVLVFALYLRLPFGKMHHNNPDVIYMAKIINRTPSAVSMRLGNFASLDPFHQERGVKGLTGGISICQPIWNEFIDNRDNLLFESEKILAEKEQNTIESKYDEILKDLKELKGETKLREVKTRVNQNVFRRIVLSNYSGKCAISGIDISDLLFASHIIPWSHNETERLNPENGICLSALYDRAYDKGIIGINEKYEIILSSYLKQKSTTNYYQRYFQSLENIKMILPQKYLPKKEFLQYHLDMIFEK
jgi:putative restriction endonuclease